MDTEMTASAVIMGETKMTGQEAIDKLKEYREFLINNGVGKEDWEIVDSLDRAISALREVEEYEKDHQKQVARKTIVKFHKDWDADFPYCPVCDTPIDFVDNYCYKCGQKVTLEVSP